MPNHMREAYKAELAHEVEDLVEDGEIDPDDADEYYARKMDEWDWGYADLMHDIAQDAEFGL